MTEYALGIAEIIYFSLLISCEAIFKFFLSIVLDRPTPYCFSPFVQVKTSPWMKFALIATLYCEMWCLFKVLAPVQDFLKQNWKQQIIMV